MSKQTLASTNARIDALDAKLDAILAHLEPKAQASTKQPKADPKPAAKPKAYRSAAGKERAKAQVAALWTKTLADAGVKRAKDLTPAQMDAYRAESKAIWAAVPKTRTTKA